MSTDQPSLAERIAALMAMQPSVQRALTQEILLLLAADPELRQIEEALDRLQFCYDPSSATQAIAALRAIRGASK